MLTQDLKQEDVQGLEQRLLYDTPADAFNT